MKLDIQKFAVTKSTTFKESNISIANNTSSLTITIEFSANNQVTYFSNKTLSCTCNGKTQTKSVSLSKGGSVKTSFTFNGIKHNADGTKSVSWNWSIATGTSVIGTLTDSGTKTLTKINRYGQITEITGNITNSVTKVYYESYNANYTYELEVRFGTTDNVYYVFHNLDSSVGENTHNILINDNYFNQFPNASKVMTWYILRTYVDENNFYENNYYHDLSLNSNALPTTTIGTLAEADDAMIDLNWTDGSGNPIFVQNHSKLDIPVIASGINNSTINQIQVDTNGESLIYNEGVSNTFTTKALTTSGSNTITATVTDSRGRTDDDTKTYNVVAYSNPTITIAEAQRCLSDGTLDRDGTYILFSFSGSISPVSNYNQPSFKISYKRSIDESYTDVTLSTSYTYSQTNVVSSFTISSDYDYDIKFTAEDSITKTEIVRTVDVGFDLLNFNPSGKSMAIGKVSEATSSQELLEVELETDFTNNVTMESNASVTGNLNVTGNLYIDNVKTLVPYQLYYEANGSGGNIQLSDSSANYDYIEIFFIYYTSNAQTYTSSKVLAPNGKNAVLSTSRDNGTYLYIETTSYAISGSNMTRSSGARWRIGTSGSNTRTNTTSSDQSIRIVKVIGYK